MENNFQLSKSGLRALSSRGYLPHLDGHISQLLTIRLIDSFPREKLVEWEKELKHMESTKALIGRRQRIEDYLDKGLGDRWLSIPSIASVIQNALLYFDSKRYTLHRWVVMPNHVHVLITPNSGESLAAIVHSWKSFTAKKANAIIERTGPFWQREYFDRAIRNCDHFEDAVNYVDFNPVRAGLCASPADWMYSTAHIDQDTSKIQKES